MANFRNFDVGGYFLNGNNSPVPNVISAPEVTPNTNGRILPPQMGIPQIPLNAHNRMDDPCLLLSNNPRNFSTLPTVNGKYQGQESSTTHGYYIQQQQQKRVYELFEFPGYKVELVITPINNHQFAQYKNAPPIGFDGQTLSSQSEISQGFLNSYGSTNNSMQSYMSDVNYNQQSFETTNPQNYQNCYNPSQQQQQQAKTFEAPAFVGFTLDNNQQSNVNNF